MSARDVAYVHPDPCHASASPQAKSVAVPGGTEDEGYFVTVPPHLCFFRGFVWLVLFLAWQQQQLPHGVTAASSQALREGAWCTWEGEHMAHRVYSSARILSALANANAAC